MRSGAGVPVVAVYEMNTEVPSFPPRAALWREYPDTGEVRQALA
jgi:hypothetical protein